MSKSCPKALYFEPGAGGHRAAFISAMINFGGPRWTIACTEDLIEQLSEADRRRLILDDTSRHPSWLSLGKKRLDLSISAPALWRLSIQKAIELKCSRIFHPMIDFYLPHWLSLKKAQNIYITGAYFRPVAHYCKHPSLISKFIGESKSLIVDRFSRRHDIRTLLTLDSSFLSYAEKRYKFPEKFRYLPDFFPFPTDPTSLLPDKEANRRKRFLLFGTISKRKGVFDAVNALSFIPPEQAKNMELLISGKIAKDAQDLPRYIEERRNDTKANIVLSDKYITDVELKNLVISSDVILAPYRWHKGSSGVLHWAAGLNKPIITQDYGLLGYEANSFKLGKTVEPANPRLLAQAMTCEIAPGNGIKFLEGRSPKTFAEIINLANGI